MESGSAASVRSMLSCICARWSAWTLDVRSRSAVASLGDLTPVAASSECRAVADIREAILLVSAAMSELAGNLVAARADAATRRDALLAAGSDTLTVEAAYAELIAAIDRAGALKTAAFETELLGLDSTLEAAERELAAVASAASSLPDEELLRENEGMLSRLDSLFATLRDSPRGPVEESTLLLTEEPPTACSLGALVVQLAAPDRVTVCLPVARRVRPGTTIDVRVDLPDSVPIAMLDAARGVLISRCTMHASLQPPGCPCALLAPSVCLSARGIMFSLAVNAETPPDSLVTIESLAVARVLWGRFLTQ